MSALTAPIVVTTNTVAGNWVPTTNRPMKSSSAASFAPKIVARDTGSAMRTRKSVSSGNSAWPTSATATATIHIGSGDEERVVGRDACYRPPAVPPASVPYLAMKTRAQQQADGQRDARGSR